MSGPVRLSGALEGERADVFLARVLPDLSRSGAQRLLEQGLALREQALEVPKQMCACVALPPEEAAQLGVLLKKLLSIMTEDAGE